LFLTKKFFSQQKNWEFFFCFVKIQLILLTSWKNSPKKFNITKEKKKTLLESVQETKEPGKKNKIKSDKNRSRAIEEF